MPLQPLAFMQPSVALASGSPMASARLSVVMLGTTLSCTPSCMRISFGGTPGRRRVGSSTNGATLIASPASSSHWAVLMKLWRTIGKKGSFCATPVTCASNGCSSGARSRSSSGDSVNGKRRRRVDDQHGAVGHRTQPHRGVEENPKRSERAEALELVGARRRRLQVRAQHIVFWLGGYADAEACARDVHVTGFVEQAVGGKWIVRVQCVAAEQRDGADRRRTSGGRSRGSGPRSGAGQRGRERDLCRTRSQAPNAPARSASPRCRRLTPAAALPRNATHTHNRRRGLSMEKISSKLVGMTFEPAEFEWTCKAAMLYALGVGAKPEHDLDYVYENKGPRVLPT